MDRRWKSSVSKILLQFIVHWEVYLKGTSRGLKALQSYMNDSYHKSVLYWPEPTIKGTMGGIRYGRNQPFRPLDVPLILTYCFTGTMSHPYKTAIKVWTHLTSTVWPVAARLKRQRSYIITVKKEMSHQQQDCQNKIYQSQLALV